MDLQEFICETERKLGLSDPIDRFEYNRYTDVITFWCGCIAYTGRMEEGRRVWYQELIYYAEGEE